MRTSRSDWHRIAAILFVARIALLVPIAAGTSSPVPILAMSAAVHLLVALGCWRRNGIALAFGLYAAFFGLLTPFLLGPFAWPVPWLVVNALFSVVLIAVTVAAWRARRHGRAPEAAPPPA